MLRAAHAGDAPERREMTTIRMRLLAVAATALLLTGCTPAEPDPSPSTSATPVPSGDAQGTCPPELLSSVSAEVSPTKVADVAPSAEALPDGIAMTTAASCVLEYDVPTGAARQVYFIGADRSIWYEWLDALSAAGYPAPADGAGSVEEGIISAVWFRAGNYDRTTDTSIVNAGWVSGPDVEGAPSDAAVLGTSYLVVTVEDCPCE
jgi:hypothetical protein